MRIKTKELWKYFIIIWMICNVISIFIPRIYLKILPYYTGITAVLSLLIFILRSRYLDKKIVNGIILLYVGLIIFILLQGKNPLNYLTILSSPIAIFCFDKISLSEKSKRGLFYFTSVVWFVLILLSFGYFDRYAINKSSMVNSNTMGMYLLDMGMFLLFFLDTSEKKSPIKSTLISLVTICSLYVGYQARGNLIAFLFFLACCLYRKHIVKSNKRVLILAILIIVVGAIIPFLYMELVQRGFFGVRVYSMKDMYTRERVWSGVVESFISNKNYLILGLPANELEIMGESLHNNSLEVLAYVGIIGMILYFAFVLKYVKVIISNPKYSRKNDLLLFAFLSLLVLGFTEVSLFWSVTYVVHYMYLGIASGNDNNTYERGIIT